MNIPLSLKGMTWSHPRGYAGLEAASTEYTQQNNVSIEWSRRSLQAFADEPIEDIANAYDFVILDHPHVGLIAESLCLLPLPAVSDVASVSMGGSVESYIWNDQQWAYPVDAACQMSVVRPDLCKQTPQTWEACLRDAKQLKLVTPLLPVDAFDMMMTLVAGLNETVLPYSATEFASRENGLKALQTLKALYRSGPSEAVDWNPITVLEAMSTTDDFAYSPSLFGYINYARPDFKPHLLNYCDLPLFTGFDNRAGILGGAGIGVSARTKYPEQAIEFAQWIMSEPVQSGIYVQHEGQPAHKKSLQALRDNPLYSGFVDGAWATMEHAWTRPRDIWFLGFVDAVCEIFPNFFLRDINEAVFLQSINSLYQHHLARAK